MLANNFNVSRQIIFTCNREFAIIVAEGTTRLFSFIEEDLEYNSLTGELFPGILIKESAGRAPSTFLFNVHCRARRV